MHFISLRPSWFSSEENVQPPSETFRPRHRVAMSMCCRPSPNANSDLPPDRFLRLGSLNSRVVAGIDFLLYIVFDESLFDHGIWSVYYPRHQAFFLQDCLPPWWFYFASCTGPGLLLIPPWQPNVGGLWVPCVVGDSQESGAFPFKRRAGSPSFWPTGGYHEELASF